MALHAPAVRAVTTRSWFRLRITASVAIAAPAEQIWGLIVDLGAHSRWNSTLTNISGDVALGSTLSFEVPQAPGQKFDPKVIEFDEPRLMRWRISRWPLLVGERSYRLTPNADGSTEFTIDELFRGPVVPLTARSTRDFVHIVEQTAADLRSAATKAD